MVLDERKWYRLNETNVARVPTGGGVYELSGSGAVVLYIGWADHGTLRDTVRSHIKDPQNACIGRNAFFFRFELAERPQERASEVVEAYRAAHYGTLPECMSESAPA